MQTILDTWGWSHGHLGIPQFGELNDKGLDMGTVNGVVYTYREGGVPNEIQ